MCHLLRTARNVAGSVLTLSELVKMMDTDRLYSYIPRNGSSIHILIQGVSNPGKRLSVINANLNHLRSELTQECDHTVRFCLARTCRKGK